MVNMTPIRVRGKKTAPGAEKRSPVKQRTSVRDKSARVSKRGASIEPTATRPRKHQQTTELSRLEQLPTELLHQIFQYSANLDLPLVSPSLGRQLSSEYLFFNLTTHILNYVYAHSEPRATQTQLSVARRLMNSNFFTLAFFKSWKDDGGSAVIERDVSAKAIGKQAARDNVVRDWIPDGRLLPPKKLLKSPFTCDKANLLSTLAAPFEGDMDELDPTYRELLWQGLEQAVNENAVEMITNYQLLGVQVDTNIVRRAVIDCGCNTDVVTGLLYGPSKRHEIDYLDPALWKWAVREVAAGNPKGDFILGVLHTGAGRPGYYKTLQDSS